MVSSPSGNSSFNSSTSVSLNLGDVVTLNAQPTGSFVAYRGVCNTTKPTCQFTLSGDKSVVVVFGQPNYIFASSVSHSGNLGGAAGGDLICAACAADAGLPGTYKAWLACAADAGLPGTYKAWLATSMSNAYARLGVTSATGWVRTDGRVFMTDSTPLNSKIAAHIAYPPRLDEHGVQVDNFEVMTGAGDNSAAQSTCTDWSSDSVSGVYGLPRFGFGWSGAYQSGCGTARHVYCLRTDVSPGTYTLPARTGRLAFVSPRVAPAGGIEQLDKACADDAAAAGVLGIFRAFAPTATSSAIGRFSVDAGSKLWQRVDGVWMSETLEAFAAGKLLAPFQYLADGGETSDPAFTGFALPTDPGTVANTCNFWSDSSKPAIIGSTSSAGVDAYTAGTIACSQVAIRAYCLEE